MRKIIALTIFTLLAAFGGLSSAKAEVCVHYVDLDSFAAAMSPFTGPTTAVLQDMPPAPDTMQIAMLCFNEQGRPTSIRISSDEYGSGEILLNTWQFPEPAHGRLWKPTTCRASSHAGTTRTFCLHNGIWSAGRDPREFFQ